MGSLATKQPWDRLEDETDKAWEAFVYYREQLNVSLADLADDQYWDMPGKLTVLERWSSKYNWVARRRAFHSWLDQQRQLKKMQTFAELDELAMKEAKGVLEAMIGKAKGEKEFFDADPRAGKDVLDRLGWTRKKVEDSKPGLHASLELDFTGMSLQDLVEAFLKLKKEASNG